MRFARLMTASFLGLALAGCHGLPVVGSCSYLALYGGMNAIESSSDNAATKAKRLDLYSIRATVPCQMTGPSSAFTVAMASAELKAGLQWRKAGHMSEAFRDLDDAATQAESAAGDQTADASARSDARDVLAQANDALNHLSTK